MCSKTFKYPISKYVEIVPLGTLACINVHTFDGTICNVYLVRVLVLYVCGKGGEVF